ncbi:juvenile hormone esterase-like [Venturia canescens]|uniref:juvenile hormone esterase-like n=1 Tax=Venturia canescens TaxID=32260 RepID=UPI001C9D350B|nr:juvenile hormone esterase-like [Venturia canescens]
MWSALYGFALLVLVGARDSPMVTTNYGTVRGKWMTSARNVSVAAYLGIPYAEPPIGELRFQSPRAWTQNWTNIRDATEDGPMCVHLTADKNILGSENCLHLNIFVPMTVIEPRLPVLVFVHGGAFISGSNNSTYFAPDYLMDQDIILVTVNYRLGIFGFLSSATEVVPGNYALKDIREALKWVQKNIEPFGGDPSIVTLAGHSAGAASTHLIALSKSSEGLFNNYITHSGSAFAQFSVHPPYFMRLRYLMVAQSLGCTTQTVVQNFANDLEELFTNDTEMSGYDAAVEEDEKILRCFRQFSPSRLAKEMLLFLVWRLNPYCVFGPTVELVSDDPIVTDHPMRIIERGEFRDIPWMTGLVADEGLLKTSELFQNQQIFDEFNKNFDGVITSFLEYGDVVANTTAFADALAEFYFPPNSDSHDVLVRNRMLTEAKNNLTKMTGDGLFIWSSYRALNYQSEKMNSSAYFFLFAYEGTFSNAYGHGIPRRYGVMHLDDMNYLFPCLNRVYASLPLHNTASDWTMINIMTEMWSTFVKNGKPSVRLTTDWRAYQENGEYMRIGTGRSTEMRMEQDFLPERMGFWEYLMANVSYPFDKLFPVDSDDDYSNESEEKGGSTRDVATSSYFSYFLNTFLLFIVLVVLQD